MRARVSEGLAVCSHTLLSGDQVPQLFVFAILLLELRFPHPFLLLQLLLDTSQRALGRLLSLARLHLLLLESLLFRIMTLSLVLQPTLQQVTAAFGVLHLCA